MIETLLESVAQRFHGEISLCALDLSTGRRVEREACKRVPTASMIKLPLLMAILQAVQEGKLSLTQPLTLSPDDKVIGAGILQFLSDQLTITLQDALTLMIALSDNTATNLALGLLGLEEANRRFRSLGLTQTAMHNFVFKPNPHPSEDSKRFGLGVTTPEEIVELLARIARNQLLGKPYDALAIEILSHQFYLDGIPRLLPSSWGFAGKSGAVDALRCDAGLVTMPNGRQLAMAIFCEQMPKPLWTSDNPGLLAIARLAEQIAAYFSADLPNSNLDAEQG